MNSTSIVNKYIVWKKMANRDLLIHTEVIWRQPLLWDIENRKYSAKELLLYLVQVMSVLCTLWELLHTTVWMLAGISCLLLKGHYLCNQWLLLYRINALKDKNHQPPRSILDICIQFPKLKMKSCYIEDISEFPCMAAGSSLIFHSDTGMQRNDGIPRAGHFHGPYSSVCYLISITPHSHFLPNKK